MTNRCPLCGEELDGRVPCKDIAFYCHACDSLFFQKTIISRCPHCNWEWRKSFELVDFNDFVNTKVVIINLICLECAKEMY